MRFVSFLNFWGTFMCILTVWVYCICEYVCLYVNMHITACLCGCMCFFKDGESDCGHAGPWHGHEDEKPKAAHHCHSTRHDRFVFVYVCSFTSVCTSMWVCVWANTLQRNWICPSGHTSWSSAFWRIPCVLQSRRKSFSAALVLFICVHLFLQAVIWSNG